MSKILKSNNCTFLFYDYETFGISPALDKPAQFACIRTDLNFNIIEVPSEFFCYSSIDYLPNPQSVLITGISPYHVKQYGLNEFEFACKVHEQFKIPNTCIIGYNNIYFDDEITRNIFYRNFIDPYEWSWKNGNSRWDILDVLRACYVLRPEGINWPVNVYNNYPSFKLSDISQSNKINHDHAHNAISDVYATLQVTQLLKEKQPKLFSYFFKHRKKAQLLKIIDVCNIKPMIYISRFFGSSKKNFGLIAPLLWCSNNLNILISFDLTKNVESFLTYFSNVTAKTVKYSEMFDKGIILVHINRCPMLAPVDVVNSENMIYLGIDYVMCKENLLLIRNSTFLKKKLEIINSDISKSNFENVDLQMYDAFFDSSEKRLIRVIHQLLKRRVFNRNLFISSKRIRSLLIRCIARNYPCMLNEKEKCIWKKHCNAIINKKSIYEYTKNILNLLELHKNNFKNVLLLRDLLKYAFSIEKKVYNI
ncbi:MAG: exodeoxyribonuclease I [Buchnera aphidicola (Meitanaphis microgallis)]